MAFCYGGMQRKGCLLNMKSRLLDIITNYKQKNIVLREDAVNDFKNYSMLCRQINSSKLTITDSQIIHEEDGKIYIHGVYDLKSTYSYLRNYFAKSMMSEDSPYRYDIYLFDDLDSKECEKLFFLEQPNKTSGSRVIVSCTDKAVAKFIREELVVNYKFIVISDAIEKMLLLYN